MSQQTTPHSVTGDPYQVHDYDCRPRQPLRLRQGRIMIERARPGSRVLCSGRYAKIACNTRSEISLEAVLTSVDLNLRGEWERFARISDAEPNQIREYSIDPLMLLPEKIRRYTRGGEIAGETVSVGRGNAGSPREARCVTEYPTPAGSGGRART